jgi:uncharacterized iron-regulated membrane protein
MNLRKIVFWIHLSAGVAAGSIVLLMSVTGVILTYERQVKEWSNRSYRATDLAPGSVPLPLESLLESVRATHPDADPVSLTLRSDPAEPVAVSVGPGRNVYVHRYTGAILGDGSPRLEGFLRRVRDWHRWLGMNEEGRAIGRAVTGACNLAFLFLVLSGLYLWWPRKRLGRVLRNAIWFRSGLRGKARDFNWHHVVGFWCWVPLVVIVAGGVVISYPWASNLVYRIGGSEPPPRAPGVAPARESSTEGSLPAAVLWEGLDELFPLAAAEAPGWQSITVRRPGPDDGVMVFAIDLSPGGQPSKRSTVTVDRESCEVVSHARAVDEGLGRRLRSWLRFAHTGEVYGVVGQTIAGLASAGAVVLVWTGLGLAWRRFLEWKLRSDPRT